MFEAILRGTSSYLSVVTVEKMVVLKHLKTMGRTRFTEIWKSGIICKGTCDSMLKALEDQGFVSRHYTSRMHVAYDITPRGKQLIKVFNHLI